MSTITVTKPTAGTIDRDPPVPYTIEPGDYDVEEAYGEELVLVVEDVEDVLVSVRTSDLGVEVCPVCYGSCQIRYQAGYDPDDWDSEDCHGCDAKGWMTPEDRSRYEIMLDRQRGIDMEYVEAEMDDTGQKAKRS